MRWIGWILAAAMIAGYAVPVSGGQPGCAGCGGRSTGGLDGEACCSPPGYSTTVQNCARCCVKPNSCCDNAWDGYCDHYARVQAFWAQVGVPKSYCRHRCAAVSCKTRVAAPRCEYMLQNERSLPPIAPMVAPTAPMPPVTSANEATRRLPQLQKR